MHATIASILVLLLSTGTAVEAEQQAVACSCAPTGFTFRLDLNRTCADNSILIGKTHGVDNSFCRTYDVQAQSSAVVQLSSILILELDSSLQVIKQHFRDGLELRDGETLEYWSIVATQEGAPVSTDDNTVAAIQMALTGETADGTEVESQFIFTYTNLCSTDVFRVGDAMSWLVVVSGSSLHVCL